MKKIILILFTILITSGSSYGAHSRGWINEKFSYEGLKFRRHGVAQCFMEVFLVNTSGKDNLHLSVVIHGKNIFDEIMWEVKKEIRIIKPFKGKTKITTRLNRYDGNREYDIESCGAYKIFWEINEINLAIPDSK